MLTITVLFALVACAFASPLPGSDISGRIVNGTDAKEGEIPYIVSLRHFELHSCGASILDSLHVLTAAHCVGSDQTWYLSIQYGKTEVTRDSHQAINVSKIVYHEDYDAWAPSIANDVAVLTLEKELPLGDLVQTVVLPEQDEDIPAGETSILAGWGRDATNGNRMLHLQRVDLLVYSDEQCTEAHGSSVDKRYHLCSGVPAGGKGQCSEDSGGPLYAGGKQIGSVSWSVKPCGVKGKPGVFARIASYVDWIRSKMQ